MFSLPVLPPPPLFLTLLHSLAALFSLSKAGLNQLGSPRLGTIVGTCSLSALGLCVLLTVNIKEAREHIEHTHEHREHALKKTAEAHHK